MPSRRADLALVARHMVASRARAQAAIREGRVRAGGRAIVRPSDPVEDAEDIEISGKHAEWASRGGIKLAHAIEHFRLSPSGRTCLDIGASTGGFTDVLLANGATCVYAIDVGHNQLAVRLRNDQRVHALEGVNARNLASCAIPPVDALVCDVSFIGMRLALPAGLALCRQGAFAIALIKPQFEAGPQAVGKGGIVRDPEVHQQVCRTIETWFSALPGWSMLGITPSPIAGTDGNREFLIAAIKDGG